MQKHIKHWLQAKSFFRYTAVLATFVVVYLSLSSPAGKEPWTLFLVRGDLVLHFICYLGMTLLYFAAYFTYQYPLKKAFISSLLLGLLMEFLQLIPVFERFFDLLDLLANSLGAGLGVLLSYRLKKLVEKNSLSY
jgi:VanZ family protein